MENYRNPLYYFYIIFILNSWHFHDILTATLKIWVQIFHAIFITNSKYFYGIFCHFKIVMFKQIMLFLCYFYGTLSQNSRLSIVSFKESAMKLPRNFLEFCLVIKGNMEVT